MANLFFVALRHLKALSILLLFILSACGGGGDDDDDDDEELIAEIRFVNAVPDSPVLVTQINESFFANISFGQATTLTEILANEYTVDVEITDALGVTEELVDDLELVSTDNEQISIILTGPVEAISTIVIENTITDLTAGSSEVVFIHAATAVDTLEFHLTAPNADINSGVSSVLSSNGYSDESIVDSGEYQLRITDTTDDSLLFDSGPFQLAALTRRQFAAINYFGAGSSKVRAVQIDTSSASTFSEEVLPVGLRFALYLTDDIAVDVYLDDLLSEPLFSDMKFGEVSGYSLLSAGEHNILLTLTGDTSSVLYEERIQLVAGQFRTATILNSETDNSPLSRLVYHDNRPVSNEAKLRVIHASPSADVIDMYLLSPGQPVSDSSPSFNSLSLLSNGEIGIAQGDYDLVFSVAGEESIVFGPERISINNKGIYSIFLTDNKNGGAPFQITLADDFVN